jgi:hypothetical protein
MLLIFMGSIILFKMLFGGGSRRYRNDPMEEYMMYQMQHDPALSHRMITNPAAMSPGVGYVKIPYPQNPNMPPPSDSTYGHRRPGDY